MDSCRALSLLTLEDFGTPSLHLGTKSPPALVLEGSTQHIALIMPLLHDTLLTAPHCPQEEGCSSPQSGIQGPAHSSLSSTKRLFEIPFLPVLHLANSYSHFKTQLKKPIPSGSPPWPLTLVSLHLHPSPRVLALGCRMGGRISSTLLLP